MIIGDRVIRLACGNNIIPGGTEGKIVGITKYYLDILWDSELSDRNYSLKDEGIIWSLLSSSKSATATNNQTSCNGASITSCKRCGNKNEHNTPANQKDGSYRCVECTIIVNMW